MARTRVDVWTATDEEGTWPAVLDAYERAIATMRGLDPPSGMRSQNAKAGLPFSGDIDPAALGQALDQALLARRYTTPTGASTYGGGERADLSFDGGERGLLENVPHGLVHSLVGDDFD